MKEDELLEYIIEGIPDPWLRNAARIQRYTTVESLTAAYGLVSLVDSEIKEKKISKTEEKVYNVERNKNQPETSKVRSSSRKPCYYCGSRERLSFKCMDKEKGRKCFVCNNFGHTSWKCPEKNKAKDLCAISEISPTKFLKDVRVNDVKTIALVDTGSDISLLQESLYKEIGKPTNIGSTLFRGVGAPLTRSLAQVRIQLRVDGENYSVVVAVVPDHLIKQELLLGTNFLSGVALSTVGAKITIFKLPENETVPDICNIEVEKFVNEKCFEIATNVNKRYKSVIEEMIENYKPSDAYDIGIEMTIMLSRDKSVYLCLT